MAPVLYYFAPRYDYQNLLKIFGRIFFILISIFSGPCRIVISVVRYLGLEIEVADRNNIKYNLYLHIIAILDP